jgi:hypothetical protein
LRERLARRTQHRGRERNWNNESLHRNHPCVIEVRGTNVEAWFPQRPCPLPME